MMRYIVVTIHVLHAVKELLQLSEDVAAGQHPSRGADLIASVWIESDPGAHYTDVVAAVWRDSLAVELS